MPTNNAWNSQDPAQVAKGGTGLSTITDHSVMVGSGTSPVTPISVGSNGQVLVGNSSADPGFSTTVAGNGNFTFTTATTASFRQLVIDNTDTATSGSNVAVIVSNGGTSSGALWYGLDKGTDRSWALGMSNVTNEDLVIHTNNSAGVAPTTGTEVWKMTTSGERTMPLQPAFLGYLASNILNITGNNTLYILGDTDVGGGVSLTEAFDQGGDFVPGSSNGAVFTTPVTGRYFLEAGLRFDNLGSSTSAYITIRTSNRNYNMFSCGGANTVTNADSIRFGHCVLADMDTGDTADVSMQVNGAGADTVDIFSGSATTFSGALIS